jgi:hypothetical protein
VAQRPSIRTSASASPSHTQHHQLTLRSHPRFLIASHCRASTHAPPRPPTAR